MRSIPRKHRTALRPRAAFVICVENEGYESSLEVRKVYQVIPDRGAAAADLIRVIDESGEDYLFPIAFFQPITLVSSLRRKLGLAGGRN